MVAGSHAIGAGPNPFRRLRSLYLQRNHVNVPLSPDDNRGLCHYFIFVFVCSTAFSPYDKDKKCKEKKR